MKKSFCMFLSMLILVSTCSSAFASALPPVDSSIDSNTSQDSTLNTVLIDSDSNDLFSTKTEKQDDILKYTISFPSATDLQSFATSSVTTTIDDQNRNSNNSLIAKEYISSLNLASSGWKCIEDACLEQLDSLATESDGTLVSYSVFVPSDATSIVAQPTATSIASFGTYSGVQFYSNIYSSYTKEYKKNAIKTRDKIKNWGSGAIDLVLCFASPQVTVPFTIIKAAMSAPSSYTVTDSAYIEYYFNLTSNCRGIYSKNTNGTYRMLTSSEQGTVAPAVLFHPVDPKYPTLVPKNFPKKAIATSNYDNKNWQLQVAYHQYSNNAYGNDPYKMTLSSIAQSATWK